MKKSTINLHDLVILVADTNSFGRRVVHGILRGFGANRVLLAEKPSELYQAVSRQKIDMLICDIQFSPQGGIAVTRSVRGNTRSENRTMPILLTVGYPNGSIIKEARDAGANMVVAKPMSANSVYDRLCWIVFNPRPFVDTDTYFGPDRRFRIEGYPAGFGRRKEDKLVTVQEEAGPSLAQDDIDSLFHAAKAGKT